MFCVHVKETGSGSPQEEGLALALPVQSNWTSSMLNLLVHVPVSIQVFNQCCVMLDLTAAPDTVDHPTLLNQTFGPDPLTSGVPQGSI